MERLLTRREIIVIAATIAIGILALVIAYAVVHTNGGDSAYARPDGLIGIQEITDAFASVDIALTSVGTPVEEGLSAILGPRGSTGARLGSGVHAWIWDSTAAAEDQQRRLGSDVLGQGIDLQVVDNVVLAVPHAQAQAVIPALSLLAVPPG